MLGSDLLSLLLALGVLVLLGFVFISVELRAAVRSCLRSSGMSFEEWMKLTACKLIDGTGLRSFSDFACFFPETFDKQQANTIFWSPQGQFVVLAGLRR